MLQPITLLPITVFYDGRCPVCSREVAVYRRLVRRGRVRWLDLTGTADVLHDQPFSLAQALTWLHVRDDRGQLQTALAAHLCLWQQLPVLRWLAWSVRRHAGLRRVVDRLYRGSVRWRPGLRRRAVRHGGPDHE